MIPAIYMLRDGQTGRQTDRLVKMTRFKDPGLEMIQSLMCNVLSL